MVDDEQRAVRGIDRVFEMLAKIGRLGDTTRKCWRGRLRGMQRDAIRAHRELHRPFDGGAAQKVEVERAELDQRALAALFDKLGIDNVRIADEVRDEQAHWLLVKLDR